jgi:N-acetylglucosaminyldiphosphoundecaprenol N-acetyl-beta-D-mannosaminyltransferase
MRDKIKILSLNVDAISFEETVGEVMRLAQNKLSAYVCFANVHMAIEAHKDLRFKEVLDAATLVLADGKPIAFASNFLYGRYQERVSGMDFTPAILDALNATNGSVFFYGSTPDVLERLQIVVKARYPQVRVAGAVSPPFRVLSPEEKKADIDFINASGADIVMVALGCPKQEKWMHEHTAQISKPLLGVGGAFPVLAGLHRRAPTWMQNAGLEWLYRLLQEPRRMFKRYLYTNTLFIYLLTKARLKLLFR